MDNNSYSLFICHSMLGADYMITFHPDRRDVSVAWITLQPGIAFGEQRAFFIPSDG